MRSWLKTIGSGLAVAVLGFFAFMAAVRASQEKAIADKWREQAVADAESDVADSAEMAEESLFMADKADERAKAAAKKTKSNIDRMQAHEPTMADITSKWRKPKQQ